MSGSNRIDTCFKQLGSTKALIPYIMAGDPGPEYTVDLMHALVKGGADIIELGVPFSDPMADGPVIQLAAERAIAAGVGLRKVLELVAQFRTSNQTTPVVLMGYTNPIEAFGYEHFAKVAHEVGVDGVLIVDTPPEEFVTVATIFEKVNVHPIFLLAPTSTEARMQDVGRIAKGYVYYVSLRGVTGSAALGVNEVHERLQVIKKYVTLPVGVGFGIRDAQSASAVASKADAVVIGSKLIETINAAIDSNQNKREAACEAASTWLSTISQAIKKVS